MPLEWGIHNLSGQPVPVSHHPPGGEIRIQAIRIQGVWNQTREAEPPCLRLSLRFPAALAVVFCRHFSFLGRLGSLAAGLCYEADPHSVFAELALLRIPSVPWMLPGVLQDSQHLPVCSGGCCTTSAGRGLPLGMCSLPLGHGWLWAPAATGASSPPAQGPSSSPGACPQNLHSSTLLHQRLSCCRSPGPTATTMTQDAAMMMLLIY